MPSPTDPFSVSLVVATRGRPRELEPRLPLWTAAGFDEVLVVDGSRDRATRERISEQCARTGARYIPGPRTIKDTRSLQRNLGAKCARGTWVLFQDDDDDVPLGILRAALDVATRGKDWLTGTRGGHIVWHRRESFLTFGGYPEDMVAAEDWIMSNRARAFGTGGIEPVWFVGVRTFSPPPEDALSRARNAFWYGYTMLLFLLRCPKRHHVLVGDARRVAFLAIRSLRRPRNVFLVGIGLWARILSPVHCLKVALKSGPAAIRQEKYSDWQGLRPDLDGP